jgi:tartrate dehydratase alpha subunit/fumarate hydratase class I-like protein
MTVIRQEDFVASVAAALQYISYYHPVDFIRSLARAYEREESPAARDAITQILVNSRMCAEGHRPICQDTGIVNVFVKMGLEARFESAPGEAAEGRAADGRMRACGGLISTRTTSCGLRYLADPAGKRAKTPKDNTPACVTVELVKGDEGRYHGRGQGRRVRGRESKFIDAESVGLDCGVGAEDGADHGRGMVSAGDAGDRDWRHVGEGDAAGKAVADGRRSTFRN